MIIPDSAAVVNSELGQMDTPVVANRGILDSEMNDFVSWLNAELEKRGWSNSELGRRAGVTGGAISHLVNRRTSPSLDTYRGIARAFNMLLEDVLRAAGELPTKLPAVAREERATYLIRSMSESGQQTALEVLESLARGDERDTRSTGERRTRDERQTPSALDAAPRQLPDNIFEVEAAFEKQLALLSPEAPDSAERQIVVRAIARVWDEGTEEDRVFLARLFDALATLRREERQAQADCEGQLASIGD